MLAFFYTPAFSQQVREEDPENLLNYAYSTIAGSGWYKVGDRRVAILDIPFGVQMRDNQELTRVGIRLLLPVALGFNNFDTSAPFPESDDVSTVSFTPGIEVEIPIGDTWLLRPFGQLGYASDLDSSESATIYTAGMKARHQFAPLAPNHTGITLGGKMLVAGYQPDNANPDDLGLLAFGFDVQLPMRWQFANRLNYLALSVYGTYYFSEAEFANFIDDTDKVRNDVTVALALGGRPSFEVLGVEFDRIGIGYKRGDGIRAITLVTEFPF